MAIKTIGGAATVFGNGLNINTTLGKAEESIDRGFVTLGLGASLTTLGTGMVSTAEVVTNKQLGVNATKTLGKTNIIAAGILASEDLISIADKYKSSGVISQKDALSLVGNVLAMAAGFALVANPVGGVVVTGLALASMGATIASVAVDENSKLVDRSEMDNAKKYLNDIWLGKPINDFFDDQVAPLVDKYLENTEKFNNFMDKLVDKIRDNDTWDFKDSLAEMLDPVREFAMELNEFGDKYSNEFSQWFDKTTKQLVDLWDTISEFTADRTKDIADWFSDVFNPWKNLDRQGNYYIYDPLILDLDGDGIETVGIDFKTASNNAYFDFDNDGRLNATGWVKSDDGLLVRDLNNDGLINNGSEIFGDRTVKQNGELATHGFDALQDLDDNKDGIINHQDTAFNTLKVWQDYNKDGISQADELKSLSDLNIQSLTTQYQNTNQTTKGGQLVQLGSFTKTDGTTHKMGDVNFNFSPVFSRYANKLNTDNTLKSLPNLGGIGRVRDLQESAFNNPALSTLLSKYKSTTTKQDQMTLLPQLLKAWAMTDSNYQEYTGTIGRAEQINTPTGGGVGLTPNQQRLIAGGDPKRDEAIARFEEHKHKIGVLDSLLGTRTDRFSAMTAEQINQVTDTIIASYDEIVNRAYIALYPQTDGYQGLLAKVDLLFEVNEQGQLTTALDFTKLATHIKESDLLGTEQGFVEVMEFLAYFSTKNSKQQTNIRGIGQIGYLLDKSLSKLSDEHIAQTYSQIEKLFGNNSEFFVGNTKDNKADNQWFMFGLGGNDKLYAGNERNSFLFGGDGNDELRGSSGHNVLVGGTGNDFLQGKEGSDLYIFTKGNGQDNIRDSGWDYAKKDTDTVQFDDVSLQEVSLTIHGRHQGQDLIISGYGSSDFVKIEHFTNSGHQVERFVFSDADLLLNELLSAKSISATDDNDTISLSNVELGLDIDGGNGNDAIYTGSGNDRLNGGNDDDRLFGGNGQDTLIGGTGNDHLDGGNGSDTYVFVKGHGQDVISEWDGSYGEHRNQDTVKFTDVRSDEIQILLDGGNLIITGYNGDDKVTIQNFNSHYAYQMERFEFSDGVVLNIDELVNRYQANYTGTNQNDYQDHRHWAGNIIAQLADGNDTIQTGSGNDRLNGGNGNDTLTGNDGNDRLNGGNDDDRLFGGNGQDTLIGGTGNDHLDGGNGSDTYVFVKGHGQDVISEWDGSYGEHRNQDTVKFTDVRSDEIQILLDGGNLIITGYNGDDKVTIQNFNSHYAYQMERFEFSDGVVLNIDELVNRYQANYTGTNQNDYQDHRHWAGNIIAQLADGNDTIQTGSGNDRLNGGNGNDTLTGNDGNDRLNGGNDDDRLFGGNGQDTLIGGTGNDHLDGGNGSDTYVFVKGHGQDVISEWDGSYGEHRNQDTVKFTDVRSDEIQILLDGGNLIITGYNGDDKVTIQNFNSHYAYQMERFEFSDGVVLNIDELVNRYQANYTGTNQNDYQDHRHWAGNIIAQLADGNDTIQTGSGNDRLNGGNGNDTLTGNDGNDRLNGGNDDDRLFGGNGQDTLIGGTGNDHLDGGNGSDTYVFVKGHGQDVISEWDGSYGEHRNQDTVKFTDVRSDEIQILLDGGNLIITGYNGDDKVTIQNFNSHYAYQMERFEFSDGVLSVEELLALKDRNKNGLTGSTERSTASADSNMQASAIMQATHALIQAISTNAINHDVVGYGNFEMPNNLSNNMLLGTIATAN